MQELLTALLELQELEIVLEESRIVHGDAALPSAVRVEVRVKALRQVVTAASDGATAAFFADRALTEMDEFAQAMDRAGRECLLYFYTPPVQRSLELFPLAERKAAELGLPLVKLDTFRYRGVAARLGANSVPWLIRAVRNETGDVIPGESIPL